MAAQPSCVSPRVSGLSLGPVSDGGQGFARGARSLFNSRAVRAIRRARGVRTGSAMLPALLLLPLLLRLD